MQVRVYGIIRVDGCLVVHRGRRSQRPYVSLPGGRVKAGETLTDALVRGVGEETGLAVRVKGLVYVAEVVDESGVQDLHLIFLARPVEPLFPADGIDLLKLARGPMRELFPPIGKELIRDARTGWSGAPRWIGASQRSASGA